MMRSNTKLLQLVNKAQLAMIEKGKVFKENFVVSTFCLFFGFMCGNLFGTFLNFFRSIIHWDGAIIALTLLFIEFINYLNFVVLKKNSVQKRRIFFSVDPKPRRFWNLQTFFKELTKTNTSILKIKTIFRNVSLTIQSKLNLFIRFLNFYKIGLLLGFFIDAFKVGS